MAFFVVGEVLAPWMRVEMSKVAEMHAFWATHFFLGFFLIYTGYKAGGWLRRMLISKVLQGSKCVTRLRRSIRSVDIFCQILGMEEDDEDSNRWRHADFMLGAGL